MWKKETIILLSILLGISISGCTQQQVSVTEMTTSVEETTIQVETTKVVVKTTQSLLLEKEEETISEPEEKTNNDFEKAKEQYEGMTREEFISDKTNFEKSDALWDKGICLVYDRHNVLMVLTMEETEKFYNTIQQRGTYRDIVYDNYDCNYTNGRSGELFESIRRDYKKKEEQVQAQNFNNEVASHIKPGGGVALVINDLNPYGVNGYTTNSMGYVVPTNASFMHYEELRKSKDPTYKLYYEIDRQVYAQNNQGKVNIIKKYTLPRLSYPVGTVNEEGIPLWVQRDNNFEVVNAHGEVFYCNCAKTFPDLSIFCGGTTTSFNGWGQFKTLDFNAYYDWIAVKGGSFGTGCLVDATQDNVDMMGLDQYTYVINYLNSIGSTIPGRP